MVEKQTVKIIRDTREKAGAWSWSNMVIKGLKTGDYSIEGLEDVFVIERKASSGEIAKNLVEARFERTLERLQNITHSYIVLEFPFDWLHEFPVNSGIPEYRWRRLRLSPRYLVSKILKLQEKYPNIKWIFCEGPKEAKIKAAEIMLEVYAQANRPKTD